MRILSLESPSRRKTVKILTIGNYSVMIIDIIQGLVFVPLYLHFIGGRLYGLWLGTGGILAVLAFLDMGIASITIQRVSREFGMKNYVGISKYFSGGLLINTAFMCVLLVGGMLLSYWLGNIFPNTTLAENKLLTQAFQFALWALILSLLNNTIEGTLNAMQKPLMGKIFQLAGAIIGIIVVYFLLLGDTPLLAIPIGMLVRSVITLFPNLIYLTILFKANQIPLINYDKATIKDYLKLTPNMMLSKIGTSLVGNIEPTLINIFISPEVAVFFSVTKKAGGLVRTVLDRIGGILYPSMAHMFTENETEKFKELCIKIINYLLPLTLLFFLTFILLNQNFVNLWVGKANYLGNFMTVMIAASLFISFFSNILSYLLNTTGDIKFSNNTVFLESMTKIGLLYVFLKYFGVIGLPLTIAAVSSLFMVIYIRRWDLHLKLTVVQKKVLRKSVFKVIGVPMLAMLPLYFFTNRVIISGILEFFLLGIIIFVVLLIAILFSNSILLKLFLRRINYIKSCIK